MTELYDRIYPDVLNQNSIGNIRLHIYRYNYALLYARFDGITLDAGCGCGYGARMLCWVSKKVVAVDQSKHAINHAKMFYPHPKIEWINSDIRDYVPPLIRGVGGFEHEPFNTIVGFEILEHIENTEIALAHLINMLDDEGRGIFSIPLNSNAPGHLRVFNETQAKNLFKPYKHRIVYQYDRDVVAPEKKPPAFIIAVVEGK